MADRIVNPSPIVEPPSTETVTYDSFWVKSLSIKSAGPGSKLSLLARMTPCAFDEDGNASLHPTAGHSIVRIDGKRSDLPPSIQKAIGDIFGIINSALEGSDGNVSISYPIVEAEDEPLS